MFFGRRRRSRTVDRLPACGRCVQPQQVWHRDAVTMEVVMAKRNRTSFQKRDRERRKAEKAARKRERREQRKNGLSDIPDVDTVADNALPPLTPTIDAEASAEEERS